MKYLTNIFEASKITVKTHRTNGYLCGFRIARDCRLQDFSAIFISGGDGTVNEVVNGMLMRKDGFKLPVGQIPGGSGNDILSSMETVGMEQAIESLLKG